MQDILAISQADAIKQFIDQFKHCPQKVIGGFSSRIYNVEPNQTLKFSNQTKKAIYHDWVVNAMILIEPKDHAYLLFIKRIDDKKLALPKGTIVVPISDLRIS